MLFSFEDTRGYGIRAIDGDIGTLHDILFEDRNSGVRYLVVETGSWLFGRQVLLAPGAAGAIRRDERVIETGLTTLQVKESPGVDSDQPVSRQLEELLHRHYDWQPYWQATTASTASALAPQWGLLGLPPAPAHDDPVVREAAEAQRERADPHLRSAGEVVGYHVAASDGDIGHVEDLLVDEASWTIRHLVVDTRNWLPGKRVLIGPERLRSVDWAAQQIVLDLSRSEVETSPEYDPAITALPV